MSYVIDIIILSRRHERQLEYGISTERHVPDTTASIGAALVCVRMRLEGGSSGRLITTLFVGDRGMVSPPPAYRDALRSRMLLFLASPVRALTSRESALRPAGRDGSSCGSL